MCDGDWVAVGWWYFMIMRNRILSRRNVWLGNSRESDIFSGQIFNSSLWIDGYTKSRLWSRFGEGLSMGYRSLVFRLSRR